MSKAAGRYLPIDEERPSNLQRPRHTSRRLESVCSCFNFRRSSYTPRSMELPFASNCLDNLWSPRGGDVRLGICAGCQERITLGEKTVLQALLDTREPALSWPQMLKKVRSGLGPPQGVLLSSMMLRGIPTSQAILS